MEFPVDLLVSGRHEDLESSAQSYMNKLLYSNPDNPEYLSLSNSRKIRISPANVGFVPLYGANLKRKVLALFAPEDQFTAVGLYLFDQWYTVEDILRTSNPAREGLMKVRSVGERIVLYVLNRIVYRTMEMGSNEVPFLCHGENDYAKLLWKNGEAVGFYSVKSKGSLCNSFVSQCYLLPVIDSIFVRKDHRGNGHGLQMLEDFVDSFKDNELGLKYPLTQAMLKVCSRYLSLYPADVDLLWEVEGVGGPYQRVKIGSKLASLALRRKHSSWAAEDSKNGEVAVNEVEMTEESCLDITDEVVVVNKHLKVTEEMNDMPISTRTRSGECRQKKRLRDEPEKSAGDDRPEKINRLVEPESETEPDVVVPDPKEPVKVESGGEQEDETTSVQMEVAAATETPVLEAEQKSLLTAINGGMHDWQEEDNEASADTPEDAQAGRECPLEAEHIIQNGTTEEEEEMEKEGEEDAEGASVQNDNIDIPEESEKAATVEEKINHEPVPGEKQEIEAEVTDSFKEEREEEVGPAVEEKQEMAPATEETKDANQTSPATETSSKVQILPADLSEAECFSSEQDSDALQGSVSHEPDTLEEEVDEEVNTETEEPTGNQETETAEGAESQPAMEDEEMEALVFEEPEEEKQARVNVHDGQEKEENITTEDEEKEEEKSWEETPDFPPDIRILRGGRSKPVPPTPKRTSSRLTKAVYVAEVEEELEEEEEKLTSTEEEKGSTEEEEEEEEEEDEEEEEEETAEQGSEEEEEPPVIDRRVLRRKSKVTQSTSKPRAKRRSKI